MTKVAVMPTGGRADPVGGLCRSPARNTPLPDFLAPAKAFVQLGFLEFARVGIPLTLVNALVYRIFLSNYL